MALKQPASYKFPIIVNMNTGKHELETSSASINTCLGLLLRTSPGELFGDPQFGSRLTEFLYDPNREALRDIIQEEIYSVVSKYEPRARLTSIDFYSDEYQENILHIRITYINNDTGTTELYVDTLDVSEDY